MNRRQYLTGFITALSTVTAGCLSILEESAACTGEGSPHVQADEPTLVPGDETTVHVAATNVTGLYFGPVPMDDDGLEVDVASASISPSPDRSLDVYPPKWYWSDCTNVDIDVPVRAAVKTEPGKYTYTVAVTRQRDGSNESERRQFTVDISDN